MGDKTVSDWDQFLQIYTINKISNEGHVGFHLFLFLPNDWDIYLLQTYHIRKCWTWITLHGSLSFNASFIVLNNNKNRAVLVHINVIEHINTLVANYWVKYFIYLKLFGLTTPRGMHCHPVLLNVTRMAPSIKRSFKWTNMRKLANEEDRFGLMRMTP